MSGSRKILAVNTAGPAVEVALSCGGYFRDENGRNASVSLMPAIDKLLTDAGMALSELDAIACVIGPGSFTGIRIGVSAARAMCYALGKPAVAVNYLQSLAYNERADGFDKILCVCDGSNGTAYIAEFDSERKPLRETVCVTMGEVTAARFALASALRKYAKTRYRPRPTATRFCERRKLCLQKPAISKI